MPEVLPSKLISTSRKDVIELMSWFGSQEELMRWGGPFVHFPFTAESFIKDINWPQMTSISAHDKAGRLLGFGQYYVKFGRCHMARLAISPAQRGQGTGKIFIGELMRLASDSTGISRHSLYVLDDNTPAVGCYRSLGFIEAPDPDAPPIIENCIYMLTEK